MIDRLKEPLAPLGCPLNPRRFNAIRKFVGSAPPDVCKPEQALDLQIAQRMLPQVRNLFRPGRRRLSRTSGKPWKRIRLAFPNRCSGWRKCGIAITPPICSRRGPANDARASLQSDAQRYPRLQPGFGRGGGQGSGAVPVNELQHYSFQVEDREPGVEYRVWVGDRDPEPGEGGLAPLPVGVPRGPAAVGWDEAAHFDGARGRVWVRLASRPTESGQAWLPRAQLPVYVLATKLSDERYNVMVAQLRRLAAGLVFDLYSKMFRSLQFAESAADRFVAFQPGGAAFTGAAVDLAGAGPAGGGRGSRDADQRQSRREALLGGRALGQRTVARLAAAGLDRAPGAPRPFPAYGERFTEMPQHAGAQHHPRPAALPGTARRRLLLAASAATSMGSRRTGPSASAGRPAGKVFTKRKTSRACSA